MLIGNVIKSGLERFLDTHLFSQEDEMIKMNES